MSSPKHQDYAVPGYDLPVTVTYTDDGNVTIAWTDRSKHDRQATMPAKLFRHIAHQEHQRRTKKP